MKKCAQWVSYKKKQKWIRFKSHSNENIFDDPELVLTAKMRVCFLSGTSLGFRTFLITTLLSTGLHCPSYHNVIGSQMNITTMSWHSGWRYLCPLREVIAIAPSSFYSAGMLSTERLVECWIPPHTTSPRSQWKSFSEPNVISGVIILRTTPNPNAL